MSQRKAASLTSSLLARKGRASPAGSLVSELGEGSGQGSNDGPRLDLQNAHAGESMKLSALKLKGQAGANKPNDPEVQLPLLAFVEAQSAADPVETVQVEAVEVETVEVETVEVETVIEAAEEEPPRESTPAASLVDRGARTLRRGGAHHPSDEATSIGPEAPAQGSEIIEG